MADKLSQYFVVICGYKRYTQNIATLQHTPQHSLYLLLVLVVCIFKIDIYRKQVTIEQHMKEVYYLETKKCPFKKVPVHSNQQLAVPRMCKSWTSGSLRSPKMRENRVGNYMYFAHVQ